MGHSSLSSWNFGPVVHSASEIQFIHNTQNEASEYTIGRTMSDFNLVLSFWNVLFPIDIYLVLQKNQNYLEQQDVAFDSK